mmetsp:Transcript_59966/g.118951  ORF Transcript_59966/g.118951 Transcript_59966/m.118951 type:complete len:575 (-) Transcript_59966:54-1778(-)
MDNQVTSRFELCRSLSGKKVLVLVFATTSVALVIVRRLLGRDGQLHRAKPLRKGRRLKVAILGGGLAGSAVALWLRDTFGDEDLDLAVICDGPVGGRCQTVQFNDEAYEAGADQCSDTSVYFQALSRRFSLKRWAISSLHMPFAVTNGSQTLFCGVSTTLMRGWTSVADALSWWRLCWRFGYQPIRKLQAFRTDPAMKSSGLYKALADGASFAHPREVLSTIGHSCLQLSGRLAGQWLIRDLRLPRRMIRELVEPGIRSSLGGQTCAEVHALAGLAAIYWGFLGRRYAVCGGTGLLPARAMEAARPRLLQGTARLVRHTPTKMRHEPGFEVAYDASLRGEAMKASGPSKPSRCSRPGAAEAEGLLVENFHLVVVAHPLEHSQVRFENCCNGTDITGTQLPPFRKSVAHFIHGTLNLRYFSRDIGERDQQMAALSFVPPRIWTTADSTTPFYSISLQFPVGIGSLSEARKFLSSAERGEPQVYKTMATRCLTEAEVDACFKRTPGSRIRIVDWHAYPQHSAPQSFRPFVLDNAGVYYVNAIEQAVSSMESSLLGARNVVNLVADWVAQRREPQGF